MDLHLPHETINLALISTLSRILSPSDERSGIVQVLLDFGLEGR